MRPAPRHNFTRQAEAAKEINQAKAAAAAAAAEERAAALRTREQYQKELGTIVTEGQAEVAAEAAKKKGAAQAAASDAKARAAAAASGAAAAMEKEAKKIAVEEAEKVVQTEAQLKDVKAREVPDGSPTSKLGGRFSSTKVLWMRKPKDHLPMLSPLSETPGTPPAGTRV